MFMPKNFCIPKFTIRNNESLEPPSATIATACQLTTTAAAAVTTVPSPSPPETLKKAQVKLST